MENGLPTPTEAASSGMEGVRNDLQRVIESLLELGVIVHDYAGDEPRSQELLNRKLKEFLDDAKHAVARSEQVSNVHVPLDILSYIDAGRNPDIYSREFVELVTKQNQLVSGEIDALRTFGSKLGHDLSEAFPELQGDVEQIIGKAE